MLRDSVSPVCLLTKLLLGSARGEVKEIGKSYSDQRGGGRYASHRKVFIRPSKSNLSIGINVLT